MESKKKRQLELLRAVTKETLLHKKLPSPVFIVGGVANQARNINRHSRLSKPVTSRELRELFAELSEEINLRHQTHLKKILKQNQK